MEYTVEVPDSPSHDGPVYDNEGYAWKRYDAYGRWRVLDGNTGMILAWTDLVWKYGPLYDGE